MPKEIHSSQAIPIPVAKELLKKREEDAWSQKEELSYIQKEALEHAIIASRCNFKDAETLVKDLIDEFSISTLHAVTLANILPSTIDEVRQLIQPESKKISTETIQTILEQILKIEKTIISKKPFVEKEELLLEDKEIDPEQIPSDLQDS